MKSLILISILAVIVLLSGCAQQQTRFVCPDGTTALDSSSCLKYCGDNQCGEGENCSSCSRDCGVCPKAYEQFIIKAYSDNYVEVPFWQLPVNPSGHQTVKLKYLDSDGFYKGSWLALYTDYEAEDIRCELKEYYNGNLNGQFTRDLIWMGSATSQINRIGILIVTQYEETKKPSEVRYDYTCKGVESGNQYSGSYTINLEYP
jgi:hypothetical protein